MNRAMVRAIIEEKQSCLCSHTERHRDEKFNRIETTPSLCEFKVFIVSILCVKNGNFIDF